MKKTYIGFAGLSLLLLLGTQTVQAQQGFGTDKPNKSAAVDIQSSKRGLLIPRVNLESTIDVTTIVSPAQSLMVYNQATTTSGTNDVTPGYYYWDGTKWARFAKQSEITEITLDGDVTGPTNATVVGKIQGVEVSDTNPTANQVLTLVNGVWTPTTITSSLISDAKGITGTGITVTGGANATLKDVTLEITAGTNKGDVLVTGDNGKVEWVTKAEATTNNLKIDGNELVSTVNGVEGKTDLTDKISNGMLQSGSVTADKLGADAIDAGKVATVNNDGTVSYNEIKVGDLKEAKNIISSTITVGGEKGSTLKDVTLEITAGTNKGDVLVTGDNGKVEWVSKADATTNALAKKDGTNGNTIVSTVNGVPAEIALVDKVENKVNGTTITTVVNGVESTSVDLTSAIEAGQKTTSVKNGSDKVTVVTTGEGTKDKNTEYTVDVVEANIKLENLGGKLPVNKVVNGNDGQVLITKDGVSTWVDQSDIVPTTTNSLTKKNNNGTLDSNTIVSTVNGKPAEVKVIDNVTNTVNGTSIVTSVNGVDSGSVDLKDAIQAGQKITTVSEGNGVKVTPADKGNNTMDYNVAINTDGGNAGDVLTVVKDGDTNTKVEWKKPEEYKNIYNSDGTLTNFPEENPNRRTVNFGDANMLVFKKDSQQSHYFTYDGNITGFNLFGRVSSSISFISSEDNNSELKISHSKSASIIKSEAKDGLKIATDKEKNITFLTHSKSNPQQELTNLVIHANGGVQVNNINKPEFAGKSTDKVVVADTDGLLKTVERAKVAPQFFYMPAVIFDTKSKGTGLVRDLYKEYVDQFTGGKAGVGNANYNIAHGAGGYTMPYTGGIVGSDGAPADIAVFGSGELHYYVTYYDTKVFANLSIDKDGKLTYDIIGNATPASYMNIVFVIK